jgi:hypothetical protein
VRGALASRMNVGQQAPLPRGRRAGIPLISSLLFGSAGLAAHWSFLGGFLGLEACFVALTLLLIGYLAVQIFLLRLAQPVRWMVNPPVLGSLLTFGVGYGLTNPIYLMDPDRQELLGLVPGVTPAMAKTVLLALVGSIAMWLGYWSVFGSRIDPPAVSRRLQSAIMPKRATIRPFVIPLLVAVSTGARLLQIKLGVFGYSSSVDRLVELASWSQYLSMAASMGKLALVLVTLQRARPSGTHWQWRASGMIVLCLEVTWGLLSGMKSAVVVPFVIVGVCRYLAIGRVSVSLITACVLGLVSAYAIIEPFRAERHSNAAFSGTSLQEIIQTVVGASTETDASAPESKPSVWKVAFRSSLVYSGAAGVDYADRAALTPEDPAFLENLILVPAYAYVPRAAWPSKPLGTLGLWYNQVVMGRSSISAEAMGPVTFLYLAGGAAAVFLGFALLGAIQRLSWALFEPWSSLPGAFVFLVLLPDFAVIESSFDGVLIEILRRVPLLLLGQPLIFGRISR